MTSRTPFYVIVLMLIVTGLSIAWLRHTQFDIPFQPGEQTTVWLIEARVDFTAANGPVLVSLDLPDSPPGFRVYTEQAASPGYGFSIIQRDGNRRGEWTSRSADGPQTLYYRVQLVEDAEASAALPIATIPQPVKVYWNESEAMAAAQLLDSASRRSSTPESMAREIIKLVISPNPTQNATLLKNSGPQIVVLEKLLNQAGIPARVSMGLYLEDARRRQSLAPLIEIFADNRWLVFDPVSGEQGLPENVLLWHRGSDSLLDVTGGRNSRVSFSMIQQSIPSLQLAQDKINSSSFAFLGIHRLPIEEQSVFKMLLLLPIGALVVVFMRIMVGIRTSGTFMPVLIALAFLQTSLWTGLVSFVTIVALGLLLRGYLSRLNLLLVARIATLVILVVFLIAILSLLGYELGFDTGMTITFFPMIIIAWTIERMSILWEEEGPSEVVKQGGGSLLVAILAYLLMSSEHVSYLSFNFPELHLVLLALTLLMGQYTGYKLSELRRFRAMVRSSG